MGGSGKWWLKSLVNVKKPPPTVTDQSEDNKPASSKKKWRLWRSSSEGVASKGSKKVHGEGSERSSDSSSLADDSFAAAIATLARAPPRDFRMVKEGWAAIRIQTAFRGLLARKALRALRAVVRIQAIFRGRQVRKQAAVTLRCMQALVRVQARVRARTVRISSEGQSMSDEYLHRTDPSKPAEQGWCDSLGSVDEVRAKRQMRQEGAIKRERALAYSLYQQHVRACASPLRRTNKSSLPLKHQKPDSNSASWSWLDRWIATKPWENSPANMINSQLHKIASETPSSRKSEDNIAAFYSDLAKADAVKVKKNGITTKALARPPTVADVLQSYSAPSSETFHNESSASTSSTSASPISISSNIVSADKTAEENCNRIPSYMNLTKSIKAKQKASWYSTHKMHRHLIDDDQLQTRSMELSGGDTKSTTGSNPPFSLSCDLYPPVLLDGQDDIKVRRQIRRQTYKMS